MLVLYICVDEDYIAKLWQEIGAEEDFAFVWKDLSEDGGVFN